MSDFSTADAPVGGADAEEDIVVLPASGSATERTRWDDGDGINEPGEDDVLDNHDDPRFIRWIDHRMDPVRRHPVAGPIWKVVVLVLGAVLVLGGLVLVPAPGPGWAVVLLGVALLATEYVWARRLLRFGNHHLARWTRWVGRQPLWLRGAIGVAAVIGVLTLVLSLLYFVGGIDLPAKAGLPGFEWARRKAGH